jgi:hypothetical protein
MLLAAAALQNLYLIMNFMAGGDLRFCLEQKGRMSEEKAR